MKDHASGCKELILISRINQQNTFLLFRKRLLKGKKKEHLYARTCIPFLCKSRKCFNFPEHLIDIIHSSERFIQNHVYVKKKVPVEQYRLESQTRKL